jgi:hypothetical protein
MFSAIWIAVVLLPLCISFRLHGHSSQRLTVERLGAAPFPVLGGAVTSVPPRTTYSNTANTRWAKPNIHRSADSLRSLRDLIERGRYGKFVEDFKTFASSGAAGVTTEDTDKLFEMVDHALDHVADDQIADMIWGLGKLATRHSNTKFRTVNQRLWTKLCSQQSITPRQVTTSFVGFAKLNIKWESMEADIRSSVQRMVRSVAQSLNEREIGNVLHSLSKMGVPWLELSAPTREALLTSLLRHGTKMQDEHGAMSLYALGILGVTAQHLTSQQHEGICRLATTLLQDILQKPPLRTCSQQVGSNSALIPLQHSCPSYIIISCICRLRTLCTGSPR